MSIQYSTRGKLAIAIPLTEVSRHLYTRTNELYGTVGMSDHTGSYMLNEILELMDQTQIFSLLGQEKTQTFIQDMIKISCRSYDCNAGEILEGLTDRFGLCYCCLKSTNDLNQGLCQECGGDFDDEWEP